MATDNEGTDGERGIKDEAKTAALLNKVERDVVNRYSEDAQRGEIGWKVLITLIFRQQCAVHAEISDK